MQKNTTNNFGLPKLAIKLNTRLTDLCPLCGEATNPNIGLEIVEDSTNLVVCRACALNHAPELAYLVNLADTARLLATSEQDFGVKFEQGLSWKNFTDKDNVIPFRTREVAK